MTRPVCVAAASLSRDTWHVLTNHGADPVAQTEKDGANAIHVLIKIAAKDTERCEIYSNWYNDVIMTLNCDLLKLMLHHEDKFSMRPIEFASHCSVLPLMLTILNTPGVYLQNKSHGLQFIHHYDITEYESIEKGNRREFSPLNFLQDLTYDQMAKTSISSSVSTDVIETWLHTKSVVNRELISLWWLLRISLFVTLIGATISSLGRDYCHNGYDTNNTTFGPTSTICIRKYKPEGCPKAFIRITEHNVYILIAFSCFVCLVGVSIDIYEFISYCKESNPKLKVRIIKIQNFYRVSNALFQGFGIAIGPVLLFGLAEENNTLINVTITFGISIGAWTILHYVQLLSVIGHYVIVVQLMLKDMISFTMIYFLIMVPFVHGFHRLANDGQCLEDFLTFWTSFYTCFRMMLNMVDTVHLGIKDNLGFSILHFAYIFIIPVLLINFLIATMSNTASKIFEIRSVLIRIQRLSVIIPLERRFHRLLACYYRYMHRRCFHVRNNRIYLKVIRTRLPHSE